MQKTISYQGQKISYRVTGTGKPVLLIHGFGEDATVWRNQVQAPSNSPKGGRLEKFKFIIPDLPGSGQSEMIDDMSMEGMAEVLKNILDTEHPPSGGGGVRLIGHSMGGYITLAFAEKYPDYLSAFGLVHSSAFADSEEKKSTRRKGIDFIKEHGAFEFLETATPNLFSQQTKNEQPGLIEQQVAAGHNFSPEALVSYYEAMIKRPRRTEVLENTDLPVLFIMGKYDKAIPLEDVLLQCHLPGKSYIHVLQNSGHMGMLEEPAKTNRALEQFLLET
ncbi:MAG: alpha/beta hydrolase [Chitinophagaceae bacterium]